MFGFFFFNDTATTEIYTLSLHDALPIYMGATRWRHLRPCRQAHGVTRGSAPMPSPRTTLSSRRDRKSTRLNSSHGYISYAVFCLKKKKTQPVNPPLPHSPSHGLSPANHP